MKDIILIGDSTTDVSLYVEVTRLCPEAPVPVVVEKRATHSPGMAGNVRANFLSMTGGEVKVHFFHPAGASTKTRYIDEATGYIMLRVDRDSTNENKFDIEELFQLGVQNIGAIVVSDYAKGFLDTEVINRIMYYGFQHKIPTFLDTKCVLGDWSRHTFCVKINNKEFQHCIDSSSYLINEWCENLVVSHGAAGSTLTTQTSLTSIPTDTVNVTDVCGAGDTMLAGLVLHYMKYGNLESAVAFANKAASFAVSQRGVYQVTQDDIARLGYPKMS